MIFIGDFFYRSFLFNRTLESNEVILLNLLKPLISIGRKTVVTNIY